MAIVSYALWEIDWNHIRRFVGCYRTLEGAQRAAGECPWATLIERDERYPDSVRLAAESDVRWGMH